MAIDALNELPESTSLPAPEGIAKDAGGWAKDTVSRLGDDYAKIVRALQGLDNTLSAPAGTRLVFDQDAAPVGWTRDTTINDRLIRVVSGARVHGGSWTISGLTILGTALTIAQLAVHNHPVTGAPGISDPTHLHIGGVSATADVPVTVGGVIVFATPSVNTGASATGISVSVGSLGTANTGSGTTHTHGLTADGTWRPLHRDMIVASKD